MNQSFDFMNITKPIQRLNGCLQQTCYKWINCIVSRRKLRIFIDFVDVIN